MRALLQRVVLLVFSSAILLILPSSMVFAHELTKDNGDPYCTTYPNFFKSSENLYDYPNEWPQSYKDAVDTSGTNFTNNSEFDFYKRSATEAEFRWGNLNSSDTSIAGKVTFDYSCSLGLAYGFTAYMNFPHFDSSSHSYDQKRCTAIHELAHVAAFGHNDVTSVLDTPHTYRCHTVTIKTLQTHDVSDIDSKY